MSIGEYASKFKELSKYCPYYRDMNKRSKCSKFENGLKPNIKQAMGYLEIAQFQILMDCFHIYENDTKARQAQWERKSHKDKKINLSEIGRSYQVQS